MARIDARKVPYFAFGIGNPSGDAVLYVDLTEPGSEHIVSAAMRAFDSGETLHVGLKPGTRSDAMRVARVRLRKPTRPDPLIVADAGRAASTKPK